MNNASGEKDNTGEDLRKRSKAPILNRLRTVYTVLAATTEEIHLSERIFTETAEASLDICTEPGIYIHSPHQPIGGHDAGRFGHSTNKRNIWWQPAPNNETFEAAGLQAIQEPGVRAVTLVPDPDNKLHAASVAFTDHILTHRSRNERRHTYNPVISTVRPQLSEAYARIPHLATIRGHTTTDAVFWEIMTKTAGQLWSGSKLHLLPLIEENLPKIIELRRMVREEATPDIGKPFIELTQRLATGRYISALFVCNNFNLFRALFDKMPDIPESSQPESS